MSISSLRHYDSDTAPPTNSCWPESYPDVSIHIPAYISYHTCRQISQLIYTYRYIYRLLQTSVCILLYIPLYISYHIGQYTSYDICQYISYHMCQSMSHHDISVYTSQSYIYNDVCTCYICIYIPLSLSPRTSQIYQYRFHTYITSQHSILPIYLIQTTYIYPWLPTLGPSMSSLAGGASTPTQTTSEPAGVSLYDWSLTQLTTLPLGPPSSPYYLCPPCLSLLKAASPHRLWVRLF